MKSKNHLEELAEKETKKVRLGSHYDSPGGHEKTITIKLSLNPRKIERFFSILIILALAAMLFFSYKDCRSRCSTGEPFAIESEQGAESVAEASSMQKGGVGTASEKAETPPAGSSGPVIPTPNESQEANSSTGKDSPAANTSESEAGSTSPPEATAPADTKIDPMKIAFQITGYNVIKKSDTWYKLNEVTVKVTNNGPKLYPQIKLWYYDDDTKNYFSFKRECRDEQSFDAGIGTGSSKTFVFTQIDESFSDNSKHPTVVARMYNSKNGDLLKEVVKTVEYTGS